MSDLNDEVRENGKKIASLETSWNHISSMLSEIKEDISGFKEIAAKSNDVAKIQNEIVKINSDIVEIKTTQAAHTTQISEIEKGKKALKKFFDINIKDIALYIALAIGAIWSFSHIWDDLQTHNMIRSEHQEAFSNKVQNTDTE